MVTENVTDASGKVSTSSHTETIEPKEFPDIIDKATEMIYWVASLHTLLLLCIVFQIFEFFMIFMHYNEALSTPRYNKTVIVRRLINLSFLLFCAFCVWGIYHWNGHQMIHIMAEKQCSEDTILNDTFKQMKEYLDKS